MYRLSLIISEIYNKYLPLAEKEGIILNLDFSDTTKEIADPDRIKQFLNDNLDSALKRSDKGEVTIGVDKDAITITDSATTLSHAACTLLSNRHIDVTSRIGFGTTVKIFFKPREIPTEIAEPKPKTQVEGVAASLAVDNSTDNTTVDSSVKLATKTGTKKSGLGVNLKLTGKDKSQKKDQTTKTKKQLKSAKDQKTVKNKKPSKLQAIKAKRQLNAAAKKADKAVKRITKKANHQAKKASKQTTKAKNSTKQVAKTAKIPKAPKHSNKK